MLKSQLLNKIPFIKYAFCNSTENEIVPTPMLLEQIHSVRVIDTDTFIGKSLPKADAWVTTQKGKTITVKTADCAPILLTDKNKPIISAVHAGWKGAMTGVIEQAIIQMMKKGATDIVAVIGPCIHVESYPVSEEMKKLSSPDMEKFFIPFDDGLHFNLPEYVKERLVLGGISEIEIIDIDTFSDLTYNSFRRDKEQSGRQYSSIWLDF
jgi:YfiH family protein